MAKYIPEKTNLNDVEYYYSVIRSNLKRLRKKYGYTQQDIADMIGSSRQYICDLENTKRCKHITIDFLGRIADALEVDIREFFKGASNKKKD